jgi:hypothetical protein
LAAGQARVGWRRGREGGEDTGMPVNEKDKIESEGHGAAKCSREMKKKKMKVAKERCTSVRGELQ